MKRISTYWVMAVAGLAVGATAYAFGVASKRFGIAYHEISGDYELDSLVEPDSDKRFHLRGESGAYFVRTPGNALGDFAAGIWIRSSKTQFQRPKYAWDIKPEDPVKFVIRDANGAEEPLSYMAGNEIQTASGQAIKESHYACVLLPIGYGKSYSDSSLLVFEKGKEVARWNLKDLPPPKPTSIASRELKTSFSKSGFAVRGEIHRRIAKDGDTYIDGILRIQGQTKNDRKYDFVGNARLTPERQLHGKSVGYSIYQKPDPGELAKTTVGGRWYFQDNLSKMGIEGAITAYQTDQENVTFKNVRIESAKDSEGEYFYLTADKPQTVRTPSGIELTLPPRTFSHGHGMSTGYQSLVVRLTSNLKMEGVELPASPLAQRTGRPIKVRVASCDFPTSAPHTGSSIDNHGVVIVYINVKKIKPGPLASITLTLEQRADIETIPYELILPMPKI